MLHGFSEDVSVGDGARTGSLRASTTDSTPVAIVRPGSHRKPEVDVGFRAAAAGAFDVLLEACSPASCRRRRLRCREQTPVNSAGSLRDALLLRPRSAAGRIERGPPPVMQVPSGVRESAAPNPSPRRTAEHPSFRMLVGADGGRPACIGPRLLQAVHRRTSRPPGATPSPRRTSQHPSGPNQLGRQRLMVDTSAARLPARHEAH